MRRKPLRETIARNQQSMDLYAALSDRPRVMLTAPPPPKPRAPRTPSPPELRESHTMAEVFAVLRSHPDVAWFARMNSGASTDDDRYVTFYRLYIPQQRVATKGISDYIGQLCDGTFFAIECKRRGVTKATEAQQTYLDAVRRNGGLAGVAQSGDDAVGILAG